MKQIKAIIQPFMLEKVLHGLAKLEELPGVTVSEVTGWGKAHGGSGSAVGHEGGYRLAKKTKLEIVVSDTMAPKVVEAISTSARTGSIGDGKIFVGDVQDAIKIRTGGRSEEAIG